MRDRLVSVAHVFRPARVIVFLLPLLWIPVLPVVSGVRAQGDASVVPPPERRAALVHFVRHDCGSCHGMQLRGGLGPALTPADLADRDPGYLEVMIREGSPAMGMPGWKALLADAEIRWIAAGLKDGRFLGSAAK